MSQDDTRRVLIIGAGAMGLTSGHHLHLAGAEVTFLVRPKRVPQLSRPQILYSYDDASLRHFSEYRLISEVAEAGDRAYDHVILTLDGAASRSAEGTALLRDLGDILRDTSAVVVVGGIGFGLREDCRNALELPEQRVLGGALGLLAHQVAAADLPVHPPTDPEVLNQADVAYRHLAGCGFVLEDRVPAAAARFKALYDASGVSRCDVVDPERFAVQVAALFPIFAACELMGWPPAARFADHEQVWGVAVEAVREVVALDEHGAAGQAAAARISGETVTRMWTAFEEDSSPLDLNAFNAFHHGGKVAAQDREFLQHFVTAGQRRGSPMTALEQLTAQQEAARLQASRRQGVESD